MPAVAALLCCCEGGTIGCDELPTSVSVAWTGLVSMLYTKCSCDDPNGTHPSGTASSPTGVSFVSPLFASGTDCDYLGVNVSESGPYQIEEWNCFLDEMTGTADFITYATITAPKKNAGAYWYVDVELSANLGTNDIPFAVCEASIPGSCGTGFSQTMRFYGPPVTDSPIGSYAAAYGSWFSFCTLPAYASILDDVVGSVSVT